MKTLRALLLAIGVLATAGCDDGTGGDESTPDTSSDLCEGEGASCETLHDCPPSGIDCVLGVCVDHACEWVNLATVETLPLDPESGLPLGKGCRH